MNRTEHYIAAIRQYLKQPRIEQWFEVEHKHGAFNDIRLTIQNGLYGYKDAATVMEYGLARIDAAELIITLTDALTASLEAEQVKD